MCIDFIWAKGIFSSRALNLRHLLLFIQFLRALAHNSIWSQLECVCPRLLSPAKDKNNNNDIIRICCSSFSCSCHRLWSFLLFSRLPAAGHCCCTSLTPARHLICTSLDNNNNNNKFCTNKLFFFAP